MNSLTTTLIICPLKAERKPLNENLVSLGYTSDSSRTDVTLLNRGNHQLILATGGHGKANFAAKTSSLLHLFPKVDLVICAGAAGGHRDHVQPFDIVVGTKTVEHDYLKKFDLRAPTPEFVASEKLIERWQQLKIENTHFAPIASGDEDIASHVRADELHRQTGAIAFAWEGAGGAKACQLHGKSFVEVRAITDLADERAAHDFTKQLPMAMQRMTEFVARVATL